MSDYTLETKSSDIRTPAHLSTRVFGQARKIIGITIHHWGRDGQDHDNVVAYLRRDNGNSSAHEVISHDRVTRLVGHNDAAWHAGDSQGNAVTIGLECRPEMDGDTWWTLVQRCADIEEMHGSMRYFRHKDWQNTACPGRYADQIEHLVRDVNAEHARRAS